MTPKRENLSDECLEKMVIIGIGPKDGDSAEILKDAKAGEIFEFSDFESLKSKISEQYQRWQNKETQQQNDDALNKYTRKELTNKLTQLFNRT